MIDLRDAVIKSSLPAEEQHGRDDVMDVSRGSIRLLLPPLPAVVQARASASYLSLLFTP